jgi:hypothetical protein
MPIPCTPATATLFLFFMSLACVAVAQPSIPPPKWEWAERTGAHELSSGEAICAAPSGDIYLAGTVTDTVRFSGVEVASAGEFQMFIVRYRGGREGGELLARTRGIEPRRGSCEPFHLQVDGDGNIFVAGLFSGLVDFGGIALYTGNNWTGFLAKYCPDGELAWAQRIDDGSRQWYPSFAIGQAGEIYFTFNAVDTLFAGSTVIPLARQIGVLGRIGADGDPEWVMTITKGELTGICDISVDNSGNLVILEVAPAEPASLNQNRNRPEQVECDYSLRCMAPDGTTQWVTHLTRTRWLQWPRIIGAGASITVHGIFGDSLRLFDRAHSIELRAGGGRTHLFLASIAEDGVPEWGRTVASGSLYSREAATDEAGNLYCAISYSDSVEIDGRRLPNNQRQYGRDVLVTCHDAAGEMRWIQTGGGVGDDPVLAMCATRAGEVYVTGWFTGQTQFGATSMRSAGRVDLFLAKLSAWR